MKKANYQSFLEDLIKVLLLILKSIIELSLIWFKSTQ